MIDYKDFPPQKLPLSKKTKEWKERSVDGVIARGSSYGYVGGDNRKSKMLVLYGLYNSEYDEQDLKYVTNPFNVEDGFPAKTQNINIIKPKIDLLIGEESKRPLRVKVIQTNDEAVGQLQEKKKQLLLQYVEKILGVREDEEGNVLTPKEIEKYLRTTYKTIAEDVALHSLRYLREKLNLDNEFLKMFKDALVSSEEIAYVGEYNGEPYMERVNPIYCDFDMDPDLEFIEDGDWFLRTMEMAPSAVYDRFYDMLDEKQLDAILDYAELSNKEPKKGQVATKSIMYRERISDKFLFNKSESGYNTITVYHAVWKSYKRVGFVDITDPEYGTVETIMVDESYKPDKGEKIRWDWIEEVWEGYRIGEDIYFGVGPIDYQIRSKEAPVMAKLPYYGTVYSRDNAEPKSLAAIMKPLQYMYIILWYRLELALARDKGKVITMDITQIPKGLGVDVNQWMHYLSALGVNFVNPYDEGWDVPGREGGKPSQFNQISALDLTMSQAIGEYINLMSKIEEMIGEISGVTKAREGQIGPYELANNVNRSTTQSSHITELLFWKHNQVKKNVYAGLLEVAKNLWSEPGAKKKLHYIFGDTERIFMEISEDFLYSDMDVFVSDSVKEDRDMELVRQLLQPAMQNGATLLDAASLITSDNMSEMKRKLADIEQRREEMMQQQSQAEQQAQQVEMAMKQEELRIKEEDSVRSALTEIEIAKMNLEGKAESEEIKAGTDMQKLEADLIKQLEELNIKKKELEEQIRKNKADERLKEKEISVKKTQASKSKTTNK